MMATKKQEARDKFLRIFYELPEEARAKLTFDAYGVYPRSLNVIAIEIKNKTKNGDKILGSLGYKVFNGRV